MPAEDPPVVVAETGAAQAPKPPAKPAQKGEHRLNFSIGHATGEQQCIVAMKVIENEGEAPFTHSLVSQTFDNIVALLNEVLPSLSTGSSDFADSALSQLELFWVNGEAALTANTL